VSHGVTRAAPRFGDGPCTVETMSISSPWPFLAVNLACLATAALVLLGSRFYREQLAALRHGRTQMLDGMRGWLALGVFFQHVMTTYFFYTRGTWDASAAHFYEVTGAVGVSLFFMITGFLFWGRVLRSNGRLDAMALYRSRLRRIVPMYVVSVLMVIAVVAALSGFTLRVGLLPLLRELRPWLSFGFMQTGDINGVGNAHIIEAVYWTLACEWAFYLALPFLALFARPVVFLPALGLVYFFGIQGPVTLNFAFGAVAALVVEKRLLRDLPSRGGLTFIPLACLAAVFASSSGFGLVPEALLFVFFLFVVHGNSLFGLLASPAAKLLGTISYSIYLVHCIVLFVVMRMVNARVPLAELDPVQYWTFAGMAAVLAVLLSSVTYRYVEYPFIAPRSAPREAPSAVSAAAL
jgi:peptidoglycan/LPS O-acetylase OafA/YrhL